MRILITGSSGQVGRATTAALADHDVIACSHAQLDITDAAAVDGAIDGAQPAWVVQCAALTDTGRCEREPALAAAVNAAGAANVAEACSRAGSRLLAISTNEVFDGEATTPYTETADARPVNAYGASKLEGERRALEACPEALIVRTAWVYGAGGHNFVERVLEAARSDKPLRFVKDEMSAPTAAQDLAEAIVRLIEADAPGGIYHLTGEGEASRFEWARSVLELAGAEPDRAEAITTAELRASGYDGPVKPPYSVLANTRARALGISLPAWRASLAAHIARVKAPANA